jgi:anaerobic magnesium-protoporphyrin IX monomethyl ester cyclase
LKPRILLVKPPERSSFNFGAFSLGVLAAAVRDLADLEILDATSLSLDEAMAAVEQRDPDLAGVTAMGFSSVAPVAAFVRRLAAARRHGRPALVAGGHGASSLPREILEAGADAVVIGEGEATFRRLIEEGIEAVRPGDPGLALLVDGQVIVGPPQKLVFPLDRLRTPARDLMLPPVDGVHLMETSRGCPHACSFCEATRFYGRRWRGYTPGRVVAEVRRLVEDFGAYVIEFADDNFTASPPRVLRICEALQGQSLPAFFLVSARADDLVAHLDLIPALAEARMLRVSVGVETLDPEVAAGVGKPIPPEVYREAFGRMRENGIFSVASLIVGLPGETPEGRARAADLAVEAAPDAARFLPFLPVPGSPLRSARPAYHPDPADVRDAVLFTRTFYTHPEVRGRLEKAVKDGDVRGLLAAGTLGWGATEA